MKRLLILIIFLIFTKNFCQSSSTPSYTPTFPKTPAATEMERFGNIPVNLFTGGIDLQIPIFSSEKNNVSLSYNSSGFIPSKKSNYVGYNWSLNYGGAITREVRGIADDFISDGNFNGFLYTVKNNPISNSSAYNNGYNYHLNNNYININGRFSELRADKFNFNFFGISGYFYIGNNGKPVVSSSTPNLIVNIDNFSYQDNFYCDPNPSGFSIVDGQGNEYYFGDNTNNVEISYSLGHHLSPTQPSGVLPEARANYMISGWYLYKVKFANGEFLNINYKSRPLYFDASNFCTTNNNYLPIKNNFGLSGSASNTQPYYELYLNANQKNSTETTIYNGGSGFPFYQEAPHYSIEVVKKVFPESIEVPDKFFIKFTYKTQQANVTENFDAYLLETIEIKNKSLSTFNVDKFEFKYNTSNKDYYFLTEIIKNTDQKHFFNYNLETVLPKFNTFGTDYWGFWNGANATQNALIPNYQLNFSTGDISITGTSRTSNSSLFDVALLNKVTYPTGGYSSFEYEPNNYSQKVTKSSSTNFIKQLVPHNDITGGARIKKISSSDGNNTITKEYKYIKDFSSSNINGPSTGILYNDYRMVNFLDLNAGSSNSRTISEEATNINTTSMSSYHIGYSEVSELENNELKKKYFFSDYASNPDSLVYSQGQQVRYQDVNVSPTNYQQRYFLRYLDNKDNERGKLIREVFYKDGNNIVQENLNIYSSLKSHKLLINNYVTLIETAVAWRMFYKFYGLPYVLKKSITKKYLGNSILEEKSTNYFEGNLHLNLTKVVKEYPDNTEFKTTYLYPEDLRHGNQPQQNYPPYFSLPYMIGKNMVGVPMVTSNYKNNIFHNRTQTVYEHNPNNNLDLPKRSLYYTEDAMVAAPLNNGFGVTMVPSASERFNEVVYDQYDSKGNLLQYTTKDGVSTVIIWGYNKTQPIAKIENAKLENISQSLIDGIINASNLDTTAERNNDETNLLNALNNFRSNLSNYQITTYTYDPLVGVRSVTPPSGIREVYMYDTAGRLKEVREQSNTGKLLKEFKYNYKQ